ncbi:MAG: hypothetical protein AB8G99_19375 [Planctomycetaceae bacterium]
MRLPTSNLFSLCLAAVFVLQVPSFTFGQQFKNPAGRYFPLNQTTPAGVAAQWHTLSAGTSIGAPQTVRVDLPTGGTVSFLDHMGSSLDTQPAPAQAGLAVGHVYRLQISGIPEFGSLQLYPSIEILDQLHPPVGMEDRYPIPVAITKDEIEAAAKGRMVTKVIYLEAPRHALGARRSLPEATTNVPYRMNLLAEADRLGRPMLILRLGSRKPSVNGSNHGFFGTGGPIQPSTLYRAPSPQHTAAAGRATVFPIRQAANAGQ